MANQLERLGGPLNAIDVIVGRLGAMIASAGMGLYRFTASALQNAPSPSASLVQTVRGPLNAEFQASDETCYVGNTFAVDIALTDGDGNAFAIPNGTPVTVTVSANGAILSEDEPAEVVYGAGGAIRYALQNVDTETAGRKQITVTVGAPGNEQTFGPCVLRVNNK